LGLSGEEVKRVMMSMIGAGQRVHVMRGKRKGEAGPIQRSETSSRRTPGGWVSSGIWYVRFFSDGDIGIYDESALEEVKEGDDTSPPAAA
jgi:hypothetical protein